MANTSTVAEKDAHDKEAQHDVDPRAATSAPLPHSADIHELARKVSRVSHLNHSKSRKGEFEDNPYEDTDNKALDPNSPEFSVKAWVAAILNLHSRGKAGLACCYSHS